jgi:hypothetical protein
LGVVGDLRAAMLPTQAVESPKDAVVLSSCASTQGRTRCVEPDRGGELSSLNR